MAEAEKQEQGMKKEGQVNLGSEEHKKSSLFTLVLIAFVDLLGLSIVIPILGPMLVGNNAVLLTNLSNETRTIILGLLLASYPIMQFFGAPILGALSDRHGRKNMLLVTEIGAIIGYVIFAIGIMMGNIWIIFVSRMLGGFMAGNLAIANSAIADISDKKSRMKNFGLLGMAFGLGFIIGPFLGGNLANPGLVSWFNLATPFWFSAILSVVNVFLILWVFRETIKEKIHAEIHPLTGFRNLKKAMKMQNLRTMFIVVFIFMFGFTFYTQFFQVFLIEKFGFNDVMIGNIFAYIGFWVALTQGVLIRPISKKFSPAKILTFSLLLYSVALLFIMLPHNYWNLLFILPFMAFFVGLTMPSSTAMVSHLASDDSQGEAMGINQSVQSAAQAVPPILAGIVAAINFNLPIIVASACFFAAWIIFMVFYSRKKHEMFHEVA